MQPRPPAADHGWPPEPPEPLGVEVLDLDAAEPPGRACPLCEQTGGPACPLHGSLILELL